MSTDVVLYAPAARTARLAARVTRAAQITARQHAAGQHALAACTAHTLRTALRALTTRTAP